jgi:hypothetical protein
MMRFLLNRILILVLAVATCGSVAATATAQTSLDNDELAQLETAPIDPSLDPADILRMRPFVLDGAENPAFPASQELPEPLDETGGRDALTHFLDLRKASDDVIETALTGYDDPDAQRIVPAPSLRAALMMLTGWDPYQATIAAILDGENPSMLPFASVTFDEIDFVSAIATLHDDNPDGTHALVVNSTFEHEPPEQLIPVLVHESLHGGGGNSFEEEVIANILDSLTYSDVLLVDPDAAYDRTPLTYYNNTELLALLNSTGRSGPGEIGISSSLLGDVFVGASLDVYDLPSIRAVIEGGGYYGALGAGGSPGQQTTAALLSRFPGGPELGPEPQYDETTLALIDRGIGNVLTPAHAVQLAQTLGLLVTTGVVESSEADAAEQTALSIDARPFVPLDLDLFNRADARPTGEPMTRPDARTALRRFLEASGVASDDQSRLLAMFSEETVVRLIPDHSLRAAFCALGAVSPWSLVVPALLGNGNASGAPMAIAFADLPSATLTRFIPASGEQPATLQINTFLAGEPLPVLASVIVQGAMIQDDALGLQEAVSATLMGTIAYADLIAFAPETVSIPTTGVMNRNRDLLALINSSARAGRTSSDTIDPASIGFLGVPVRGDDLLPGLYADAASFSDYVASSEYFGTFDRGEDQVAPAVFEAFLREAGITPPQNLSGTVLYDSPTLRQVDALLTKLFPEKQLLATAAVLNLGISPSK